MFAVWWNAGFVVFNVCMYIWHRKLDDGWAIFHVPFVFLHLFLLGVA